MELLCYELEPNFQRSVYRRALQENLRGVIRQRLWLSLAHFW
jgi:hypothetical protein